MGIKLGNTGIGGVYVGGTKIIAAYMGSTKVFEVSNTPYLVFTFTDTSFDPRTVYSGGPWNQFRPTSTPGVWRWTCEPYHTVSSGVTDPLAGWKTAFSTEASVPVGKLTPTNLGNNNTVSITGYGGDLSTIETIDRMFANCTSITSFVDIPFTSLANSSATFKGCVNVTSGALDMYNSLSSLATPPANHADMFADCGSSTQAGTAELAQIPVAWGGTYVPAAGGTVTLAVDTSRKMSWTATATTGPIDFSSTSLSVNIYTTASVSQYAGVNMRKTNIKWYSGSTPSGTQLYYYTCFIQCDVSGSRPGAASWLALAESYNGTLTGSQASGDMPGTLDYNAFGAIKYLNGTYDANSNVHFAFLVSPLSPTAIWTNGDNPLTDAQWGLLNNSYFLATTLNYI